MTTESRPHGGWGEVRPEDERDAAVAGVPGRPGGEAAVVAPREPGDLGWWGMLLLVFTEAMLFAFLLASYFYAKSQSPGWPPEPPPELRLPMLNTGILLASSGTMWWAERAIGAGRTGWLRAGLLATVALGAVFLTIQGIEYAHAHFGPATHAYGSLFFVITGFHGSHVAVGLAMILFTVARAWLGHFSADRHLGVRVTAFYWHFVDVVWLFVFTSLYLSPRFL